MSIASADAATLLANRETSPKTASVGPKSYLMLQPNPGGLTGFKAAWEDVARNPLSKNLTDEAGDHVGMSVSPQLVHDLTLDFANFFAGDWYRCTARHPGGSGQSFFRPTAAVDGAAAEDSFTVDGGGAVPDGTLVIGRGWANAANNTLLVTTGGSTNLAVKVATGTLVAEAAPANATLDVVGFQGEAGDLKFDANGDMTCVADDFTARGIVAGMWIKVGGTAANTSFADQPTYNGWAQVDPTRAITANLLPLRRHSWTPGPADAGAGKTIQIFLPRFFRNYALDHASFDKATSQLELEVPSIGAGDVSSFRYFEGLAVGAVEIDAPLKNKIVVTTTFVGMDVPDPVLQADRPADTATALEPLAARQFNTSSGVRHIRLARAANNAPLVDEINSWSLSLNLNVKAQEIQGVTGANGHIHGKFQPSLSLEGYHTTDEVTKVIRSNDDVSWIAIVGNGDGALAFDIPAGKMQGDEETFAEGEAVMISLDVPAHRETASNMAGGLCVFGHIPQ